MSTTALLTRRVPARSGSVSDRLGAVAAAYYWALWRKTGELKASLSA